LAGRFSHHASGSHATEFVIDQGQQIRSGFWVALVDGLEQPSNVVHALYYV
jgi:hypothetical protein